jgi:hypothetical protein
MLALSSMKSIHYSESLTLVCHPQTPSRAIQRIEVVVGQAASGLFTLAFILQGDLSALHIPEERPPRRADGLWQHTCFETFVMAEEGPGYRELNFSPSRAWQAYTFRGYREGRELEVTMAPDIVVQRNEDRLELAVEFPREFLPPGRSLRLGLSAVVEGSDGMLSYWALRHPPGRPDFHHPDAFALQLVGS